jgi:hypothetical protein
MPSHQTAKSGGLRQRLLQAFNEDAGPATQLIRATDHEFTATSIHTLPHSLRSALGARDRRVDVR